MTKNHIIYVYVEKTILGVVKLEQILSYYSGCRSGNQNEVGKMQGYAQGFFKAAY